MLHTRIHHVPMTFRSLPSELVCIIVLFKEGIHYVYVCIIYIYIYIICIYINIYIYNVYLYNMYICNIYIYIYIYIIFICKINRETFKI